MLKDISLIREIEDEIKNKLLNVEQVVQNVFQRHEQKLRGAKNNVFQERANDIVDVGKRLLKVLLGVNKNDLTKLPKDAVILAQRLLPSDTAMLNVKKTSRRKVGTGMVIMPSCSGEPIDSGPSRLLSEPSTSTTTSLPDGQWVLGETSISRSFAPCPRRFFSLALRGRA